jgi:hypothetical protein
MVAVHVLAGKQFGRVVVGVGFAIELANIVAQRTSGRSAITRTATAMRAEVAPVVYNVAVTAVKVALAKTIDISIFHSANTVTCNKKMSIFFEKK